MARSEVQTISYVSISEGRQIPKKQIYLLRGKDSFPFFELEKILLEKFLSDDPSGYNFMRFRGKNLKASDLINFAEEYPFGALYRVVSLADAQKIPSKEREKVINYLYNPSPTTIFIIYENTDKSERGKLFNIKALRKIFSKKGVIIDCNLSYRDLRQWVKVKFSKEGKRIGSEGIELLLEMVGTNLWDLNQEILKISLYVGRKSKVSEEDIREIASHHPNAKIFNLTDSLGNKNITESILILNELLKEKVSSGQILSAIYSYFSLLYSVYKMSQEGLDPNQIAKKLHKHPYYIKKCFAQSKRFSKEKYSEIFEWLSRADSGIKTGMDTRWVLEILIINICSRS